MKVLARAGRAASERWDVALGVVLLAALVVRLAWLATPNEPKVFDEAYYVNATRVLLGWGVPLDAPYAGAPARLDPNTEHPPLGKVLMAGSMWLLGDTPLGWRLPSIAASMASLALLAALVRAAGGGAWLGVLAAGLFAFDNLALVHGRIGTLDMLLTAFLLLAAWGYLRGRGVLAGVGCAAAALVKLNGVYGLGALGLLGLAEALAERRRTGLWPAAELRRVALMAGAFAVTWIGGLWLLDLRYTSYRSPWEHTRHMVQYGMALARERGPANWESEPWQWMINEVQIPYFRVDEQVKQGEKVAETRATVYFRGAMNPIVIGAAPLALPFAAWRAWRGRDRVAWWALAWIAGTYLPFVVTATFAHRISYLYYFLPTLPAVTVCIAQLLRQGGLPRPVLWGYLAMVVVGFIGYYPIRRWM